MIDVTVTNEAHVRAVAARVADVYTKGKDARMKYVASDGIDGANLEGFGLEEAVSAWIRLPWNEGKRGVADVGHNVETRQSKYDDARLLLYQYDDPLRIYILGTGRFPTYTLRGWVVGRDFMVPRWRFEEGSMVPFRESAPVRAALGMWAIPQSELRSMESLPVRR